MSEHETSLSADGERAAKPGWLDSLSLRLFLATLASILLVEALIFVPSAANFRSNWIEARVQAARIAALSLDAAPSRMVSEELSADLLQNAEVLAVAEIEDEMRFQLLAPQAPIKGQMHEIDLRDATPPGRWMSALSAFGAPDDRVLVITAIGSADGRVIEVVVPQAPLKKALSDFARRVAGLSLLIALVASALIYLLLYWLVVRPMQRVTRSVEQFRDDPGSWTRSLKPTRRRDEIGRAQNALADMEAAVAASFRQKARLAELGEAVAKINHDLRNSLASAQLVSDSLQRSDDPRVMRAAPRLERALERAIKLTTQTLEYGRADTPEADLQSVGLHAALEEAASEALAGHDGVTWRNDIPQGASALADPDHLHRIAANLIRNAAQAMGQSGGVSASFRGGAIEIADTGPGLPAKARDNLFKPFAGSSRRDGTGLGLAISRDLARSMGWELDLARTGKDGTVFRLTPKE